MDNQNQGSYQPPEPGKSQAITSLVLGIISIALWFFGYTAIGSLVLGIVGIVMAVNSKKLGYNGPMRTAGFVLSIIGVIIGGLVFLSCVACAGIIASIFSDISVY
jgi:hypothetical protein